MMPTTAKHMKVPVNSTVALTMVKNEATGVKGAGVTETLCGGSRFNLQHVWQTGQNILKFSVRAKQVPLRVFLNEVLMLKSCCCMEVFCLVMSDGVFDCES